MSKHTWKKLIEEYQSTKLKSYSEKINVSDINIKTSGKPSESQIREIIERISLLNENQAIILPGDIMYQVDPKTVRKNMRRLSLRRIKTRKEAIDNKITPLILIQEKTDDLRRKKHISILQDYSGINFRSISNDHTNKNYLVADAIEGYNLSIIGKELISIKRYDTLDSLIMRPKNQEKGEIGKELKKIRPRKFFYEYEKKAREVILRKQSARIANVPSTSKHSYHKNIRFLLLPQTFSDNKTPELNNEFYATWFNIKTNPSCNCSDKANLIDYIHPGEVSFCLHEIAGFRAMLAQDHTNPEINENPYIATAPFFKPTKEAINLHSKLKKQVFVKRAPGKYTHLPKIYINSWLVKATIGNYVDLTK